MTDAEYERAIKRIYELIVMDPDPLSKAGQELERLGDIVEKYEEINFPIDFLQTIKFKVIKRKINNT